MAKRTPRAESLEIAPRFSSVASREETLGKFQLQGIRGDAIGGDAIHDVIGKIGRAQLRRRDIAELLTFGLSWCCCARIFLPPATVVLLLPCGDGFRCALPLINS